jgi:hypothetical protein
VNDQRDLPMHLWVIYDHPRDFPDRFVARKHHVVPGASGPTLEILTADTLDDLRAKLPAGLVLLSRHPMDDPVIVETWL